MDESNLQISKQMDTFLVKLMKKKNKNQVKQDSAHYQIIMVKSLSFKSNALSTKAYKQLLAVLLRDFCLVFFRQFMRRVHLDSIHPFFILLLCRFIDSYSSDLLIFHQNTRLSVRSLYRVQFSQSVSLLWFSARLN